MPSRSSQAGHVVPWRRLILLIVLVAALVVALLAGSLTTKSTKWTPEFALDLQGGTQIILTPVTTDGSDISQSDIDQAIEIIRQRVDASGVAEAEITSQGGQNIVVGLPGTPSQETLNLVRTSAVLRMRPVLQVMNGAPLTPAAIQSMTDKQAQANPSSDSTTPAPGATDAPAEASETPSAEASETPSPTPSAAPTFTPEELDEQAKRLADTNGDGVISDQPATTPSDGSDPAWITEKLTYEALKLNCITPNAGAMGADDPSTPIVACSSQPGFKYILGPASIEGTQLTKATSGFNQQDNKWVVAISFDSEGTKAFGEITTRLVKLQSPRNQFAIVLDGKVLSAPVPNLPILDGKAEISGNFNAESASTLANQLSFGSLPLNFQVQSEEQISATLGSESLASGLLAGLVGLILVVLYLLWQYHGLGLVAAGSVVIATALSYLTVCLLSWIMGYRLSMAGVVGLIISVGITADSFIVFFERIRDEIREGRSLVAAVSHGWHRAKRTIIVADGVNLLCSVVLYFLAVGSVRGFAFTLGLTTLIDLVIVMMFTYPVMTLLVRTKFFGEGRRFSGMNPEALGRTPAYRGRGQVRSVNERKAGAKPAKGIVAVDAEEEDSPIRTEGAEHLSLAERRARERRAKLEAERSTEQSGEPDSQLLAEEAPNDELADKNAEASDSTVGEPAGDGKSSEVKETK